MSVSFPLKQIGRQKAYELRLELYEADEGVSRSEQRNTTAALLGFLDEMARTSVELSDEQVQCLRYRQKGEVADKAISVEEKETLSCAELVGRRLRGIGDEYMDRLVRDPTFVSSVEFNVLGGGQKSAAQSAAEHFCEVVNMVFECNEYGVAVRISLGRIAALLSYCYYLCKVFMEKNGVQDIVGFLGQILGYLIRCLYKSKFYEWLSSLGGWKQLLKQTYSILPSNPRALAVPLVIGGTVVLGLMIAYRYFVVR